MVLRRKGNGNFDLGFYGKGEGDGTDGTVLGSWH